MINKDLPYEQQMMLILKKYDKLVDENMKLKNKVSVLENSLSQQGERMQWIRKTLEDYLSRIGEEIPKNRTITYIIKKITSI